MSAHIYLFEYDAAIACFIKVSDNSTQKKRRSCFKTCPVKVSSLPPLIDEAEPLLVGN